MSCIFNYFFRNATLKTPLFGLKGKTKWAKVVKVYDGDTIHVVFYLGFKLYRWKCNNLFCTYNIRKRMIELHEKIFETYYCSFVKKDLS